MKQNRRTNSATKRESIREKKSDAKLYSVNDIIKMKKEIIYVLLGEMKIMSVSCMRQRGARMNTFLCLFIFFQLNLPLQ